MRDSWPAAPSRGRRGCARAHLRSSPGGLPVGVLRHWGPGAGAPDAGPQHPLQHPGHRPSRHEPCRPGEVPLGSRFRKRTSPGLAALCPRGRGGRGRGPCSQSGEGAAPRCLLEVVVHSLRSFPASMRSRAGQALVQSRQNILGLFYRLLCLR